MVVRILLLHLLFIGQLHAQSGAVFIRFSGINHLEGDIQLRIFNNSKGFPSSNEFVIKTFRITSTQGDNFLKISDLPYGEYAISCYHDRNGNKKLDTNFLGIPKEKVGASNNPSSSSIPSYEDAKFILNKENLTLLIQLN